MARTLRFHRLRRRPPGLDPEAARILVAGRLDADEPFRDDEGIDPVEEGDDRQLVEVDLLDAMPERLALVAIELDLHLIDETVHFRIPEPRIILAAPAIGGAGDLGRAERRPRHILGRADPGVHGKRRELAVGEGVAEEDATRLILDADVDPDGLPLALEHLLD